MKLVLKRHKVLQLALFPVLITSLWGNNIYMLFLFSLLCWFTLPYKKWWDNISISLLLFSISYTGIIVYKGEVESNFLLASYLFAPAAFYRLGRCLVKYNETDKDKQKLMLAIIATYLFPLFLLTAQDIALTGLINESRVMLMDIGEDTMKATFYGMMSSVGIGCVGTLFIKGQNKWIKAGFILLTVLSLLSVIHLVNRTGLVICALCLVAGFVVYAKKDITKTFPFIFLFLLIGFVLSGLGDMSGDMSDAYTNREDNADTDVANAGGRVDIWLRTLGNILVSPMGWKREYYAHNLWLDIARVGGWLSLFLFFRSTFSFLYKVKSLFKKACRNKIDVLLLTVNLALLLSSAVEPVIDASILFFSLLMFQWGFLVGMTNEKTSEQSTVEQYDDEEQRDVFAK